MTCKLITALGMNIDKADTERIIYYSIPKSLEDYSQKIRHTRHHDLKSTCLIYVQTHKVRFLELTLTSRLIPCPSKPKLCAQVFGRNMIQRKLGLI